MKIQHSFWERPLITKDAKPWSILAMKRAQEARNDPLVGQKGSSIHPKRKGSTSKESTKSESSNQDETACADDKGASNDANNKQSKKDGDGEDNFEGDYFRDFYYNQGDYRNEELEEVEEIKHAKEIEEHEKEEKTK